MIYILYIMPYVNVSKAYEIGSQLMAFSLQGVKIILKGQGLCAEIKMQS
jgi:hypothetical protein